MTTQLEPLDEFANHVRATADVMDLHLIKLRLEEEHSRLRAQVGSFSTFEHRRKLVLSSHIADTMRKVGTEKKPTEKVLDAEAHDSREYKAFVDEWEDKRDLCLIVEARIAFVQGQIDERRSENYRSSKP